MLNKTELIDALKEHGIDEGNYRTLALLPLVLVAWADGKVQQRERSQIIGVARDNGFLTGGGEAILEQWLANEPLPAFYHSGFRLLIEIARKEREVGADISVHSLRDLLDFSYDVAKAAGGIFGGWSVSATERDALDHLASVLAIDDGGSWSEMLEDLGD